jgi:tRNA pseudouridine55 synthase
MTIEELQEGAVLLIDKPLRWTSFDVVNKIRWLTKVRKVGHAGTLDPLATGLLIVCTGKKTKQIDSFQSQQKEYTGAMVFGKTTPSIDLETEFDSEKDTSLLTKELILAKKGLFEGLIQQIPPIYSAVKINGKAAYKSARKGQEVEIKPRSVEINQWDFTDWQLPQARFLIRCSKGTYIRSLVRDLGEAVRTGAYLSELRRTAIGDFRIENALSIEQFQAFFPKTEKAL